MPLAIRSVDQALVVGVRLQPGCRATEGQRSHTTERQLAYPVSSLPENGRVGGHRVQHRQPGPEVVEDLHAGLRVGDADVHVHAVVAGAGDEQPKRSMHPVEAGLVDHRRDRARRPGRCRWRAAVRRPARPRRRRRCAALTASGGSPTAAAPGGLPISIWLVCSSRSTCPCSSAGTCSITRSTAGTATPVCGSTSRNSSSTPTVRSPAPPWAEGCSCVVGICSCVSASVMPSTTRFRAATAPRRSGESLPAGGWAGNPAPGHRARSRSARAERDSRRLRTRLTTHRAAARPNAATRK